MGSFAGEQEEGKLSHDKAVGHFHPEESASRMEALQRDLAETGEAKERQEVERVLKDELEKP